MRDFRIIPWLRSLFRGVFLKLYLSFILSCLSYYNSSLNRCWSVSTVQKQKPIMAEAQSCGRVARVTWPSDWSLDNQEVGDNQSNEGHFIFCCVRLHVLDLTYEYLPQTHFCVEGRYFSQWFTSPTNCRFNGMTGACLPSLNAGVFRAKFGSLR